MERKNAAEFQDRSPATIVKASYGLLIISERLTLDTAEFSQASQLLPSFHLQASNSFFHVRQLSSGVLPVNCSRAASKLDNVGCVGLLRRWWIR